MSNGSQEDRIERPQLLDTIRGHHLSGVNVCFATPVELVPLESKSEALPCRFQHSVAFWDYFFSDAIACDDRDVKSLHEPTLIPSHILPTQTALPHLNPTPSPSRNQYTF